MRSRRKKAAEHRNMYQRDRAIARSLHARVFITSQGRLMLVRGKPQFVALLKRLSRAREVPATECAPSPVELGFPVAYEGELTAHSLQTCSRALKRWQLALEIERRRLKPTNGRRQSITAEEQEISRLQKRLSNFHNQLRAHQQQSNDGGINVPSSYALMPTEELELQEQLKRTSRGRNLPSILSWTARVVFWIAGKRVLQRFLEGISPFLDLPDEQRLTKELRVLCRRLGVLRKRSEHERGGHLHAELRKLIGDTNPRLVTAGQLTSRLRGRSIQQLCDQLIQSSQQLLMKYGDTPLRSACAGLAALVICDRSLAPVPQRLVRSLMNMGLGSDGQNELYTTMKLLYKESEHPGYDKLLSVIGQLEQLPSCYDYGEIRSLAARGVSATDIQWVQEQGVLGATFDSQPLTVAWARHFERSLTSKGVRLEPGQLSTVIYAIESKQDLRVFDRFVRWLYPYSLEALNQQVRRSITSVLMDHLLPAIKTLSESDDFRTWSAPLAVERDHERMRTIGSASTSYQCIAKWLRRIAIYQQLDRQEPAIPRSIVRYAEASSRRDAELTYLQSRVENDEASFSQKNRLANLQGTARQWAHNAARNDKLRRMAQESCISLSLQALRGVITRASYELWNKHMDFTLPTHFRLARVQGFATWVSIMDDKVRATLRRILSQHRTSGRNYKNDLPGNAPWLNRARRAGMDTERWMNPPTVKQDINGRACTIAVESEPFEIFQMGNYFRTCLSIGDCNSYSVLSNAHEANKHVIFIRDAKGKVIARQLIAISKNYSLLGYESYIHVRKDKPEDSDALLKALERYCGTLARRCGMQLADEGEPESIANLFWYDDGTCAWSETARAAWAEADQSLKVALAAEAEFNDVADRLAGASV